MNEQEEILERLRSLGDVNLGTIVLEGEAASEPFVGKLAVAYVIKNRMEDPRWPDTWTEVILQPKQFSCLLVDYFNEDWLTPKRDQLYWRECRIATFAARFVWIRDPTNGANHYHATYIDRPYWAKGKHPVFRTIGHWFYKL